MKAVLKTAVKLTFRALLLPIYLWFELLARLIHEDSAFQSLSQYLSLIPGKLGSYCRAAFFWWACPDTSDDVNIGFLTVFSHRDTTLERGVYIGPQCNIGKCHLAENSLLGSGVHVLSGKNQHHYTRKDTPIKEQGGTYTKIKIGANCWIGNGAIIMAEVKEDCIVAAGSLLAKNLSERGIVIGGNPAKKLKDR